MSMTINRVQIETLWIGKILFKIGKNKKENLSENKFGLWEEEKNSYKIRSRVKFPRAGDRVPVKFMRNKRLKYK